MTLAVIVLAAGEGTRMRSRRLPKVLHGFAGRSMLGHVLAATAPLSPAVTLVVVGHGRDQVIDEMARFAPHAAPVVQDEQLGTGHAVALALAALSTDGADTVLVVPGDAPLLEPDTLGSLIAAHARERAAATMLTSVLDDPTGYGRVVRRADGTVERVVEQNDATADELAVREVAVSTYVFDAALLRGALERVGTDNAQGEQYLTDVVGILVADGERVVAVTAPGDETAGVNDRVQLVAAARTLNSRLLTGHMRRGVTVLDPATTWVDVGVELDPDVVLLPGTELRGRTRVAEGAVVGPQTTLIDTTVGPDATLDRVVARGSTVCAGVSVGPFAYLRPGTVLADGVHVGSYVEIKNSSVGAGSKVPHLSYVGDATIGTHSNIGAATVFVNYDGVAKHRTVVGDHVRVGSDTMLVAPVTVGDGAYTAAGSVVDQDVPPGALAIGRGRQRNVEGWVARRRAGTPSARAAEAAGGPDETENTSSERPGS